MEKAYGMIMFLLLFTFFTIMNVISLQTKFMLDDNLN